MPDTPLSLFISYSRTDSEFVDRLEADLKARSFRPWVDRRKIEGGQDWMDVLQQAIDSCQILLLVLSPEAMDSKYVRREYRYADQQGKPIIPLNWRTTRVPMGLNDIQWVNFQSGYDQGLNELLAVLSRQELAALPTPQPRPASINTTLSEPEPVLVTPQPAPAPPDADLNELYRAGVSARAQSDLERTAIFWQQVLARDSSFGNGTLKPQMDRLMAELHPLRVQRLRAQAEQAHRAGQWGQEIGAWQALLGLEPNDRQAKERIPVAQQNQQFAWVYENAQEFAKTKNIPALKEQLGLLWHDAPYYGDPAGLARLAGIKVPPSFQEATNAQSRAQAAEAEAKRKVDQVAARKQQREELLTRLPGGKSSIGFFTFCGLAGVGVSIGTLSQSWPWAVAIATALAVLLYILEYYRILRLPGMFIILLISEVFVFGITWFLATFHYDQSQVSHLWFGIISTVTLRHQVIFGVILGAIAGYYEMGVISEDDGDGDTIVEGNFWIIGILLAVWFIFALLGSLFDWGFGFGYGWGFTWLAGIFVAFIGGMGLTYPLEIGRALRKLEEEKKAREEEEARKASRRR